MEIRLRRECPEPTRRLLPRPSRRGQTDSRPAHLGLLLRDRRRERRFDSACSCANLPLLILRSTVVFSTNGPVLARIFHGTDGNGEHASMFRNETPVDRGLCATVLI